MHSFSSYIFSYVLTFLINGFVLLGHWEQCLKNMVYMAENVCFDFLLLRQKWKLLRTFQEFLPHQITCSSSRGTSQIVFFFFFQCKHNDVILTVGREKLGCLIWKIAKNDTFSSSSLTIQCFYSSQYLTPSFTLNKSSWVPVEITHILSSLCTLPHLERKNKSVLQ